eukprot:10837900-Karenia_brevis.AAC.1
MNRRVVGEANYRWSDWYHGVMENVDAQAWEVWRGERDYIEYEWTQSRVANPVLGPDVPNDFWLDNLKKMTQ